MLNTNGINQVHDPNIDLKVILISSSSLNFYPHLFEILLNIVLMSTTIVLLSDNVVMHRKEWLKQKIFLPS